MKVVRHIVLTMALFITMPSLTIAQYFQKLFDTDSTQDGGWKIFAQPDGCYFITGSFAKNDIGLVNMKISSNGENVFHKNLLQKPNVNLYTGNNGELKNLPNGGYISPLSLQIVHDTFYRGWAGMIKYTESGDTVFLKTYTDTTIFFDLMQACGLMPDGGYILGGIRAHDTPGYAYPGLIIRTDSMGDTIWTHTYQKFSNEPVRILSVVPLPDGRIAVGACSERKKDAGPPYHFAYFDYAPWFMLLDNAGNIIRDTLYNVGFQSGGFLYPDLNGGYYTIGRYDSLFSADPDANDNFPSYIAHLDTNFRITWITSFPFSIDNSHREIWLARQLKDGSYIVLGDRWSGIPSSYGWVAKVSRYGNVIWDKLYSSDLLNDSYFRDVAEKPDGSLVLVGTSFNDTLPRWRKPHGDIWLVGVDSNGCENVFCAPVKVNDLIIATELTIFPNPTSGNFTIKSPDGGTFELYSLLGQKLHVYNITSTSTGLKMPIDAAPGIYFGRYRPDNGDQTKEVKLIYQP